MRSGFPPVINSECTTLIVGSFPSLISLERGEYYANPRNDFWRIMEIVLNMPPGGDYDSRINYLLSCKIGLWDVVSRCIRSGSSDTAIRNPDLSPVWDLLHRYPNIRFIVCNGRRAETGLKQALNLKDNCIPGKKIQIRYLPSTSPAHTIPFEEKCSDWMIIRSLLTENILK